MISKLLFAIITICTQINFMHGMEDITLATAIRKGNTAKSRELIQLRKSLETQDEIGETPLTWAIYREEPSTIIDLIEAGANPEGKNSKKVTPLRVACEQCPAHISTILGQIHCEGRDAVKKALLTTVSLKEFSSKYASLNELVAIKWNKILLYLPDANKDEATKLIVESYSRLKTKNIVQQ